MFYTHKLWTYNYVIYILHTHTQIHTQGISNTVSENKEEWSKFDYQK